MRITGGKHKGRTFAPPRVKGFRPTMEKVRQAVFAMIESQVDLSLTQVLDCYSGSGAFGLESISRGSGHCTFIEKNPDLLDFTKKIAEKLQILGSTKFIRGTLPAELGKLSIEFDLVFADPPYDTPPGDFLTHLLELKILKPDGILVFELAKSKRALIPQSVELSLELLRDKTYGDTEVIIYRKKPR